MRDLAGMTALITGASRGIGAQIADALGRAGVNLILVSRSRSGLEQVAERLGPYGQQVYILPADLSQREAIAPLVKEALIFTGSIDILVNNAATACFLPYHRYMPEDIEREIFTNLTAPLLLTRYVLPHMLARRCGHIVNVSSLGAEIPVAYLATYATAKAGLASFSRSLRQELSGTGVSASAIMPGVVRDVGLIRDFEKRSGFSTAGIAGGCTSEQVARGVIDAIRRDLPDIVINAPPMRPILALLRLMPKTMERVLQAIGIQKSSKDAIALNVQSGGMLTGVIIAPDEHDQVRNSKSRAADVSNDSGPSVRIDN